MEKITYGIQNVYYAKATEGDNGALTYGSPVALKGATEISFSTVGEPIEVYADDTMYYKESVNQGYDGNLNIYAIPESFYTDILGMTTDENGVLVEKSTDKGSAFALMFEFLTDSADTKRTVLYNCTASRPEISESTKEETVDPEAFSIPIKCSPRKDNYKVKASVVGNSTDETWAGWFTSVYEG